MHSIAVYGAAPSNSLCHHKTAAHQLLKGAVVNCCSCCTKIYPLCVIILIVTHCYTLHHSYANKSRTV